MRHAAMHACSLAYAGDVTALYSIKSSILDDHVVLFGIGSQLHVHLLTSGERLVCETVLPFGIRIHGIFAVEWKREVLLAVHGDRHVRLLGLDPGARSLRPVCQLPRFHHWTLAVHISVAAGGGDAVLAVGLSENSLEAFHLVLAPAPGAGAPAGSARVARAERVLRVESTERCLLFSMALHPRAEPDGALSYLVACGTIFWDVVVWATPSIPCSAPTRPSDHLAKELAAGTMYCLKGHRGAIHRVRWSADAAMLASASDDRTLRVWGIPPAAASTPDTAHPAGKATGSSSSSGGGGGGNAQLAPAAGALAAAPVLLQPRHVLFGHTAHLWDCAWGQGLIVSASEDCSCKFWDLGSGALLATIQGHRGRGIWQCALLGELLLTAGADSSVKCWYLPDWLPPAVQADLGTCAPAAARTPASSRSAGVPTEPAAKASWAGLWESYELLLGLPSPDSCAVGAVVTVQYDATQAWPRNQPRLQAQPQQHMPTSAAASSCLSSQGEGHSNSFAQVAAQGAASSQQLQPPASALAAAAAADSGAAEHLSAGGGGKTKKGRKGTPTDSKGEWVRSMAMAGPDVLYVATNQGLIHRVLLPSRGAAEERWETLYVSARPSPLASLAVVQRDEWHWVGACDLAGRAVVLRATGDGTAEGLGAIHTWEWQPYGGRTALGVFLAPKLGANLAFTAGLDGALTLWALPPAPSSASSQLPATAEQEDQGRGHEPSMPSTGTIVIRCPAPVRLAGTWSPHGGRLISLDATLRPGMVACGDQHGAVVVWALDSAALGRALQRLECQPSLAGDSQGAAAVEGETLPAPFLRQLAASAAVHGATPVRMVRIEPHLPRGGTPADLPAGGQVQGMPPAAADGTGGAPCGTHAACIITAGADASVKMLALHPSGEGKDSLELVCIRVEHFDAVTTVDGDVEAGGTGCQLPQMDRVVHGFQATNYVIFSATHDCEVARGVQKARSWDGPDPQRFFACLHVLKVPCGGCRRPSAVWTSGPDEATFCFVKEGGVHVYRRQRPRAVGAGPASGTAAAATTAVTRLPPRCLHPAYHGKEQHVIKLLPAPPRPLPLPDSPNGAGSAGDSVPRAPLPGPLLACVTGGEEATLRQVLLSGPGGGAAASSPSAALQPGGGAFAGAGWLGDHLMGSVVKALTVVPNGAGSWLAVSGGARNMLNSWRLSWEGAQLACEWVNTRPPRGGFKPKSRAQGDHSKESDLRIMALSAFLLPALAPMAVPPSASASAGASSQPSPRQQVPSPPAPATTPRSAGYGQVAFVAAASSDASLSLLACHLAQRGQHTKRAWQPVATLRYHTCPVLSTAHVEVSAGDAGIALPSRHNRHLVFSGATDGCVAVWDLSPVAERYLEHYAAADPRCGPAVAGAGPAAVAAVASNHAGGAGRGAAPGAGGLGQWQEGELKPVLCLEGVHQSGVNDMTAVQLGPDRLLLMTGGDDQALCFTLLTTSPALGLAAQLTLPNAHASSVRGVWTDGGLAFSTGLDQRVRAWRVALVAAAAQSAGAQHEQQDGGAASAATVALDGRCGGELPGMGSVAGEGGAELGDEDEDEKLLAELEALEVVAGQQLVLPQQDALRQGVGWRLGVREAGCFITQVLEPSAIDVAREKEDAGGGALLVGVAGRGTELLRWQD